MHRQDLPRLWHIMHLESHSQKYVHQAALANPSGDEPGWGMDRSRGQTVHCGTC